MGRLPDKITIMSLLAFRVIKDLVVDMDQFFAQYEKIKPYLINNESPPLTERLQTPEQHAWYEEGTKCIFCSSCTSLYPMSWGDPEWVGPTILVNAHRFSFDSRDRGAAERLDMLSDRLGIFRCRTVFNCTECCPRDIPITDLIE
jgi:succinate dehydrogenase / fumarate reductase iron-sulfur subunit